MANGLAELGLKADDRIAIDMPMTVESVAIYLGAVAAGCPVVAVADSFAPAEIAVRLEIGQVRCIFTQDFATRLGKRLPLYEKVRAAGAPQAIVLPCGRTVDCALRDGDLAWQEFLSDRADFEAVPRGPQRRHDRSCSPRARAASQRPSPGTRLRRSNPPSMRTCTTTSARVTCSAGRAISAG